MLTALMGVGTGGGGGGGGMASLAFHTLSLNLPNFKNSSTFGS